VFPYFPIYTISCLIGIGYLSLHGNQLLHNLITVIVISFFLICHLCLVINVLLVRDVLDGWLWLLVLFMVNCGNLAPISLTLERWDCCLYSDITKGV
jgi:hypothetical protein